jgi:hypothetical protein
MKKMTMKTDPTEFWKTWAEKLTDRDMVNAFTFLGIAAAASGQENFVKPPGLPVTDVEKTKAILKAWLEETLQSDNQQDVDLQSLAWMLPVPDQQAVLKGYVFSWSKTSAKVMADVWKDAISHYQSCPHQRPMCINVITRMTEAGQIFWLNMLYQSIPTGKTVWLDWPVSSAEIQMKWPISLGVLAENPALKAVKASIWQTNAVCRQIGRDDDNCDFIVYYGSAGALKDSLSVLPVPMKCNLLIIKRDIIDEELNSFETWLRIGEQCRAAGLVILDSRWDDSQTETFLKALLSDLIGNSQLAAAISSHLKFSIHDNGQSLIFLTEKLAKFRLTKLYDYIIESLDLMSDRVKINIPEKTRSLLKMDAPAEKVFPSALKSTVFKNKEMFSVLKEFGKSDALDEWSKSVKMAETVPEIEEPRKKRYISAKTFIRYNDRFQDEKRALLIGIQTKIIVRIGPPEFDWVIDPNDPIPEDKLPKQKTAWNLSVVLSDPFHIREPLLGKIKLPKEGPSTECEFCFTPGEAEPFTGRLIVSHRGRVIQTTVLSIQVVKSIADMPAVDTLKLSAPIAVRENIADLDSRRQFDLSLVTEQSLKQRPVLTGIAKDHAWLVNLDECLPITREINQALSEVALSVEDYKDGLSSKKGQELLLKLVFSGCELYSQIVESELMRPANRAEFAKKEYLQIVSTKDDVVIPFEFIYEHEVPDNDAHLCSLWQEALESGKCRETCSKVMRKTICPLGFWGLSKVIERHDVTPELGKERAGHFLQSEVTANRAELNLGGSGLLAASSRVTAENTEKLRKTFESMFHVSPLYAANWQEWETEITLHQPHLQLIVALPHTQGHGSNATLEIGGDTIRSIQIRSSHVKPSDASEFPIVALLGCDLAGTAEDYCKYVRQFRQKGAAVVIATIATVFGGHAAHVAEMLIEELAAKPKTHERIGEVMRSLKRKALQKGLLMALCLVAFGDADWKIN